MKRIDAKVAEITGEKRDGKKEEDQGRRDTEKKGREDVIVSPSHQEDSRTGQDRRDDVEKSGAKRGVRLLCAPPPPDPSRTTTPIPGPEPPFLVRKAQ